MPPQRGHGQLHLPRLYLGSSGLFNSWGGMNLGPLALRILATLLYGRRMTDERKWCAGGMTVCRGKPKYSETILSQCHFAAFHRENPKFDPSVIHVGYAVDKITLGHVSLRVLRISPVNCYFINAPYSCLSIPVDIMLST